MTDIVRQLREDLADLRETVTLLRGELGVDQPIPFAFKLTRSERIVFGVMLARDIGKMSNFFTALYSSNLDGRNDSAESNVIGVWIHHIRRKVAPFGVTIENVRGEGFRLPPKSKAIVRAMLEAEAAE